MDPIDRKWVLGGAGCAAAGLMISLATGKWSWFAVGASTGAAVVGGRLYFKARESVEVPAKTSAIAKASKSAPRARSPSLGRTAYPNDMVGGPTIDPEDTNPANKPRLLRKAETDGYPMRHRIPECEVHSLSVDDKGLAGWYDEPRYPGAYTTGTGPAPGSHIG